MYDKKLFLPHFLSPPKKKREEEKDNEWTKPILNKFFRSSFKFYLLETTFIRRGNLLNCTSFVIENLITKYELCLFWATEFPLLSTLFWCLQQDKASSYHFNVFGMTRSVRDSLFPQHIRHKLLFCWSVSCYIYLLYLEAILTLLQRIWIVRWLYLLRDYFSPQLLI